MTSSPRAMTDTRNEQKEGNVSKELEHLEDRLSDLATSRGMWFDTFEEGGLTVLELHPKDISGPGSERFIRFTGFTITSMIHMARVCLNEMPRPKATGEAK